jgi:hypothetical protein
MYGRFDLLAGVPVVLCWCVSTALLVMLFHERVLLIRSGKNGLLKLSMRRALVKAICLWTAQTMTLISLVIIITSRGSVAHSFYTWALVRYVIVSLALAFTGMWDLAYRRPIHRYLETMVY